MGKEVVYCRTCGARLYENAFKEGKAIQIFDKCFCEKCKGRAISELEPGVLEEAVRRREFPFTPNFTHPTLTRRSPQISTGTNRWSKTKKVPAVSHYSSRKRSSKTIVVVLLIIIITIVFVIVGSLK